MYNKISKISPSSVSESENNLGGKGSLELSSLSRGGPFGADCSRPCPFELYLRGWRSDSLSEALSKVFDNPYEDFFFCISNRNLLCFASACYSPSSLHLALGSFRQQ